MNLVIYNSLTRQKEEFVPIQIDPKDPKKVGVYTCGPTIYDYPTIGNWRTYTLADITSRILRFNGYKVFHVMNMTDVGHLTGDNLGDASTGEDRMLKAALRENKTAWDIAKFYGDDFIDSFKDLNIIKPDVIAKPTDHISEQIELIKQIEAKGFTYKTSDGIYFDVIAYEKTGNKYGELSTLDVRKEGARVEPNPEKKDPRDFALWKFSYPKEKRHMEWDSPWGRGFPGWHIECSAMSMKYLGDQFDIHLGGEDLRSTHHPNEIAQSEAATDHKPFVKYWIHGAFLLVDGGRMGKSLGNAYNLHDIKARGISPLALRYFYLSGHYRKQINFTWEALEGAATSLQRLADRVRPDVGSNPTSGRTLQKFLSAINDDINMPQALAVAWEVAESKALSTQEKSSLLIKFDEVLGLGLKDFSKASTKIEIPENVQILLNKRQDLRNQKKFDEADKVREEIEKLGYEINDTEGGVSVRFDPTSGRTLKLS